MHSLPVVPLGMSPAEAAARAVVAALITPAKFAKSATAALAAKHKGPFNPKVGEYPTGATVPGYGPLYVDKDGWKFASLPPKPHGTSYLEELRKLGSTFVPSPLSGLQQAIEDLCDLINDIEGGAFPLDRNRHGPLRSSTCN